jgi:hypoxanthine phosphoribosyltransferase
MKKIFVEWSSIDQATNILASLIKDSQLNITHIMGLPRGGMVPAVMLSHKLNIPFFGTGMILNKNILVVDDICDTGETLNRLKQSGCLTASIHFKSTATVRPDFWYGIVGEEDWIVYPWENRDSQTIPDYKL